MQTIVQVTNVGLEYRTGKIKVPALRRANLTIKQGEFVAITGTSGSGKSTLLHLIGGLDQPDTGTVEIQGQDLSKLHDAALSRFRNKTIGFVFQSFYLQPFLNLRTNIEVPAIFSRTKRAIRRKRSTSLTEKVGLASRISHLPKELSGGQIQRTAIARALVNNPSIILADEPTGNLDRSNALDIFKLFRSIVEEQHTTVIVVTHDLELAKLADRTIHMSDGETV